MINGWMFHGIACRKLHKAAFHRPSHSFCSAILYITNAPKRDLDLLLECCFVPEIVGCDLYVLISCAQ
jgi:hypothetical protein